MDTHPQCDGEKRPAKATELARYRGRCEEATHPQILFSSLKGYPFVGRFSLTNQCLQESDRLRNFVSSLRYFQKKIQLGQDEQTIYLRKTLGDPSVAHYPSDKRATRETMYRFTYAFALLERIMEWEGITLEDSPIVPKTLREEHLKKANGWPQLRSLSKMLRRASELMQTLEDLKINSPIPDPNEKPFVRLLKGLAYSKEESDAGAILDNFRVAAMYIAYTTSLPPQEDFLPDLPEDLTQLYPNIDESASNGRDSDAINRFLDTIRSTRGEPSRAQLAYAAHLLSTVSPLFLFVRFKLFNTRRLAWQSLFELSVALGNDRPPILLSLEKEVLHAVFSIAFKGMDVRKTVYQLTKSEIWRKMESLDDSDHNILFFHPGYIEPGTGPLAKYRVVNNAMAPHGLQTGENLQAMTSVDNIAHSRCKYAQNLPIQTEEEEEEEKEEEAEEREVPKQDGPQNGVNNIQLFHAQEIGELPGQNVGREAGGKGISEAGQIIPPSLSDITGRFGEQATQLPLFYTFGAIENDQVIGYGPRGEERPFTIAIRAKMIKDCMQNIYQAARCYHTFSGSYCASSTDDSVLRVLSQTDLDNLSDEDVQLMLRTQHLVICGASDTQVPFEKAIRNLGSLNKKVQLTDQCFGWDTKIEGTLQNFVSSLESDSRSIISAQCIAQPLRGFLPSKFSSDIHALHNNESTSEWTNAPGEPVANLQWVSIFATGAFQEWQVADKGFGMQLSIDCGAICLLIARPKSRPVDFREFSSIYLYLDHRFNARAANKALWDIEAINLEQGESIILKPNTPHCIYCIKDSVIHGSFFYSASNIQETYFGIIHSLLARNRISFLTMPSVAIAWKFRIENMVAFCHAIIVQGVMGSLDAKDPLRAHVPHLSSRNSVLDFMTLATLACLLGILEHKMPAASSSRIRGLGTSMMYWLDDNYLCQWEESYGEHGEASASTLAIRYLALQSRVLVYYIEQSKEIGYPEDSDYTAEGVRSAIKHAFAGEPAWLRRAISLALEDHGFSWTCFPHFPGDWDSYGRLDHSMNLESHEELGDVTILELGFVKKQ